MIIGEEGVKGLLSLVRFEGINNNRCSIEWAASSLFESIFQGTKLKRVQKSILINEYKLGLKISKDSEME